MVASGAVISFSLLLAIGWYDKTAVLGLSVCLVYAQVLGPSSWLVASVSAGFVLLVHIFLPAAPYGSVARMSRSDPGTFWRLPPGLYSSVWLALAVLYAYGGVAGVARCFDSGGSVVWSLMELFLAVLAVAGRGRLWAWIALMAGQLGLASVGDAGTVNVPFLLMHALAFDPAWVPGVPGGPLLVFYDGGCGLCHRVVRFVLSEDRHGIDFRFAPLDGELFVDSVPAPEREGLPDSVVVMRVDKMLLVRSEAMIEIGRRLGGLWRILAEALARLPRVWRDACYDAIASLRRYLFARPQGWCPLIPPYLLSRFPQTRSRV